MPEYVHFDRTEFPLITMTFTGEKATEENFQEYLDGLYHNYDRRERIGLMFDASEALFPSVKFQRMMSNWMKANEDLINEYCVGTAYVIPNKILRKAIHLIFNMSRNPVSFKVVPNVEKGKDWLKSQF